MEALLTFLSGLLLDVGKAGVDAIQKGQDWRPAVNATLARATALDPGDPTKSLDEITAAHLARVRAAAKHVDTGLLQSVVLSHEDRDALNTLVAHASVPR